MKGLLMETTGKALVEHWNWASEKGVMNKNTALGLRAACSQVMSVLEDWESVDIKTLNVDDALRKFQNLKAKEFKPQVLETYKRRFRLSVSSYLSYLQDPGSWKGTTIERAPRQEKNSRTGEPEAVVKTGGSIPTSGLVDYPFPLRDGQIIRLVLPRDLKKAEVKRLSAFMSTLAVDSEAAAHDA
jgi:hypothetical protein